VATCGRISCASTEVETGPIWPPASIPSITSASAPERISFLASASAGAKQISLAPLPLIRSIAPPGGKPAGEHDMGDLMLGADVDQLAQLRVHGDQVDAERLVGALLGLGDLGVEQLGVIAPQAITPKPPALEMAETRWRSETQLIAPPRIAIRSRGTRCRGASAP
jgi:hypothetical protein